MKAENVQEFQLEIVQFAESGKSRAQASGLGVRGIGAELIVEILGGNRETRDDQAMDRQCIDVKPRSGFINPIDVNQRMNNRFSTRLGAFHNALNVFLE